MKSLVFSFFILLYPVLQCEAVFINAGIPGQNRIIDFSVRTYDSLILPARVILPEEQESKMVLFINGSTPYDEKGNIGAIWNDRGVIIKERHDFYLRFIDIMTSKGYPVATLAKRSFVYPARLPRPSLTDLAFDIRFFIEKLKSSGLIKNEKDLVIVGYSEGSIVASKVLPMLTQQPYACILLGSATMRCNCESKSIEDFYLTDILRRKKNWNDDRIMKEWSDLCSIHKELSTMNEEKFEKEYKNSRPHGFGFAMWESFYIDREVPVYDPIPNMMYSNIPILICSGEDDSAMPLTAARKVYEQLKDRGAEKVFFHTIEKEVHQYKKYDVFGVMNAWLQSGCSATGFTPDRTDSLLIEKYRAANELVTEISAIPFIKSERQPILAAYEKAETGKMNDPGTWFILGVKLFANDCFDEAFDSFSHASDSSFAAYFAPIVWMGHIKDLNKQRQTALKFYKKALEAYPGFPVQHSHWNMTIDKNWIEERLKSPFKGVE